jgi:asparagine synthase (glutamine-hydrolysing)
MCGILGIISYGNKRNLSMVSIGSLRNRGPDGVGRYIDNQVSLYHTRLAVIDKMITSQQPIVSKDGNLALICNGEIYNYQELKKRYGYDYQTTSDCEVILSCYSNDGVKGFTELRGMFSFGIYDKKNGKMVIYRDAVGKKPLFYYQDTEIFIFSSSVKAIRDNLSITLDINKEALMFYLKEGYIRPDISFYDKIFPILPGTLLEWDILERKNSSYRVTPTSISYDLFEYSEDNIIKESEKLLDQSIKRRLYYVQNPVLLFSGGIDSTVLAQRMMEIAGKKLICISLKPVIPLTYDEPYGIYAAKRLNLTYISVGLALRNLKENVEMAIRLLDQPLSLYSYHFLTYLTRKAREFGNVLFTGEGGDEVFYGYSDITRWFLKCETRVDDHKIQVGPDPRHELSDWGKKQVSIDLLGHSFVKIDKATAEQQMEARCPYLDWDLMNFLRAVPPGYFIRSKTTKVILKRLLTNFPDWFIYRKKIGSAFNFRYLMIPFYKYIYNEINFEQFDEYDLSLEGIEFSYLGMFVNFDKFWKLYVLSKFISYQ